MPTQEQICAGRRLLLGILAASALAPAVTQAAVPGITGTAGPTFNLRAEANYISQPDGNLVYSWGYGCQGAYTGGFAPAAVGGAQLLVDAGPGPHDDRDRGRDGYRQPHQRPAAGGRQYLDPVPRF